jgi:hypothetical protein
MAAVERLKSFVLPRTQTPTSFPLSKKIAAAKTAAAFKADAQLPNREDVWPAGNCLVHQMAVAYFNTPSFASPIQGMQGLQLPCRCESITSPAGAVPIGRGRASENFVLSRASRRERDGSRHAPSA